MNSIISIIIPTFNSVSTLEETLESVFSQHYDFWECIIVDDGSNDETVEILKKYKLKDSRFKWYNRPENKLKGPSSARNYGLKKSIGEYIVFLDSDDVLSPSCLENRIIYASKNPRFDFWIFKMTVFAKCVNDTNVIYNTLPLIEANESNFYYELFLQGKYPFIVTCPLWKKSSLDRLNGFDEFMNMLEDPDLHLRAYKVGMISKTALELDTDCYYRIICDHDRALKREKYNKIAAKSNFYFFKKHMIVGDVNVKKNYKRIFNSFAFTQTSFFLISKLISLGLQNKIINMKYVFLAYLIFFYILLNFSQVKGIGYTKLRNEFNTF